ncbi:MAG TPA: DNA-directed RNA polymerase subunit P [Euryarchaeota archaeon]|nr:DNA-directed RNA polymerase subunit P [archaeon BMS3Bbin15]HDL14811.1 DNA-directed RNA polymerase subunit P [Euryarchaeota archaeon]
MYRCGNCGKEVDLGKDDSARCPFCGYKILFKIRPQRAKRVKAF